MLKLCILIKSMFSLTGKKELSFLYSINDMTVDLLWYQTNYENKYTLSILSLITLQRSVNFNITTHEQLMYLRDALINEV